MFLGTRFDTSAMPCAEAPDGTRRRVGVEIEFSGLSLEETAACVQRDLGGAVEPRGPNARTVTGTALGDVTVELDADVLHVDPDEHTTSVSEGGMTRLLAETKERALKVAGDLSSSVVPTEIVTPPIAPEEIPRLDGLLDALRRRGAAGTTASPLNGFGLHLNPQIPSGGVAPVAAIFRSYLLVEDALWHDIGVDLTRHVMPFISRFPRDYAARFVATAGSVDWSSFIDAYVDANPTRNRSLDLLPLFAEIDPRKVAHRIDDPLVKPRPTFHYRLPDCRLDDPDWSIGAEWRRWICIERLAADRKAADGLADAYARRGDVLDRSGWIAEVAAALNG